MNVPERSAFFSVKRFGPVPRKERVFLLKKTLLVFLIASLVLCLVSCAAAGTPLNGADVSLTSENDRRSDTEDLPATETGIDSKTDPPEETGEVSFPVLPAGATEGDVLSYFSRNVLAILADLSGKNENLSFSPVSLYIALSMASEGAAGDTVKAFSNVLCLPEGKTAADVCSLLLSILDRNGDRVKVSSADAVWLAESLSILPSFEEKIRTGYSADVYRADFSTRKAVEEINSWVRKKTNGKIEGVLDEPNALIRMLLANSVYLDAEWMYPFPAETFERPFYGTKETVSVPTMGQKMTVSYLSDDSRVAVALPYAEGGLFFVAVCPRDGTAPLSLYASEPVFSELLDSMSEGKAIVRLPKLEEKADMDLTEVLKNGGLRIAFSGLADFSEMSEESLCIDSVIQKTYVRVDEKGTEAAAVTVIDIRQTSVMEPEQPVELNFDHPFLWSIVDSETGIPLFVGIVNDLSD